MDELRRTQEGSVAEVEGGGGYLVDSDRGFAKPPGNLRCVLQKGGCSGDVAAALK
jgi:hypothetical protein